MQEVKNTLKSSIFEKFYTRVLIGTGEIDLIIVLLAIVDIWWSAVLLLRPTMFAENISFEVLQTIMPQLIVAFITLIVGVSLLHFWTKSNYRALKIVTMIQLLVWLIVTLSFIFSNPLTTGTGVYMAIGLKSAALYLRLKRYER